MFGLFKLLGLGEGLSKFLGVLVPVLVAAGAFWFIVHSAYERGVSDTEATWKAKVVKLDEKLTDQRTQNDAAIAKLKADNDLLLADLRNQLQDAEARAADTRVIVKEVTKYVTKKADSQCVVPAGAVWVLQSAVAPESAAAASAVSGGRPADVDAPSGVALSSVVGTTGDNLAECVERGAVIRAWQDWYVRSRKSWNEYRAKFWAWEDELKKARAEFSK